MPQSSTFGTILIVDSDDNVADLLKVNLGSQGYGVTRLLHASEVDRSALSEVCLVIADSMLEEYSGLDLVYDLRDDYRTEHIGIILYSVNDRERMIIDALDAGADDYIVKPFSLREMVVRVKSVLRRRSRRSGSASVDARIELGTLSVDMDAQSVSVDGIPVTLSRTEFAILALLLKNKNMYVSRTDIHRSVWGDEAAAAGNERIVDTNISRLRKKLGSMADRIYSCSGIGYMIS